MTNDQMQRLSITFLASVGKKHSDVYSVAVATGAGAQQILVTTAAVTAAGGTTVYLMGLQGTLNGAGAITVEDADATDLTGAMTLTDEGGFTWPPSREPYLHTTSGQGLALQATTGDFNGLAQVLIV